MVISITLGHEDVAAIRARIIRASAQRIGF
jgi:hypothetical protein